MLRNQFPVVENDCRYLSFTRSVHLVTPYRIPSRTVCTDVLQDPLSGHNARRRYGTRPRSLLPFCNSGMAEERRTYERRTVCRMFRVRQVQKPVSFLSLSYAFPVDGIMHIRFVTEHPKSLIVVIPLAAFLASHTEGYVRSPREMLDDIFKSVGLGDISVDFFLKVHRYHFASFSANWRRSLSSLFALRISA